MYNIERLLVNRAGSLVVVSNKEIILYSIRSSRLEGYEESNVLNVLQFDYFIRVHVIVV